MSRKLGTYLGVALSALVMALVTTVAASGEDISPATDLVDIDTAIPQPVVTPTESVPVAPVVPSKPVLSIEQRCADIRDPAACEQRLREDAAQRGDIEALRGNLQTLRLDPVRVAERAENRERLAIEAAQFGESIRAVGEAWEELSEPDPEVVAAMAKVTETRSELAAARARSAPVGAEFRGAMADSTLLSDLADLLLSRFERRLAMRLAMTGVVGAGGSSSEDWQGDFERRLESLYGLEEPEPVEGPPSAGMWGVADRGGYLRAEVGELTGTGLRGGREMLGLGPRPTEPPTAGMWGIDRWGYLRAKVGDEVRDQRESVRNTSIVITLLGVPTVELEKKEGAIECVEEDVRAVVCAMGAELLRERAAIDYSGYLTGQGKTRDEIITAGSLAAGQLAGCEQPDFWVGTQSTFEDVCSAERGVVLAVSESHDAIADLNLPGEIKGLLTDYLARGEVRANAIVILSDCDGQPGHSLSTVEETEEVGQCGSDEE